MSKEGASRIVKLEKQIADLQARMPKHSVPASMMMGAFRLGGASGLAGAGTFSHWINLGWVLETRLGSFGEAKTARRETVNALAAWVCP